MATLGQGQRPDVMPHYPHFLTEDTVVWTRFLEQQQYGIKRVWYDVRVGMSALEGTQADDMTQKIAAGLTRKRIDVVAEVGGGHWVIEIKPRANMMALGQVLTYTKLFAQEYQTGGEVHPVIICSEHDPDLLDEFDMLGIVCLQVD